MQDIDKNVLWTLPLEDKIEHAKQIITDSLKFLGDSLVLCWTGGKDSTLLLWLVREVCREQGCRMPQCLFIDEGDSFPEIDDFVRTLKRSWHLSLRILRNADILGRVKEVGDIVTVADLSEENLRELELAGHTGPEFIFEPGSAAGTHLLKTVPLRNFIRTESVQGLLVALRWDEHDARSVETFTSSRDNPAHTRVHPILHFRERDIWDATLKYDIPYCSLYRYGYRSLGARSDTRPVSDIPAWEQDLEHTDERGGRGKAKEQIMAQLRSLGYM